MCHGEGRDDREGKGIDHKTGGRKLLIPSDVITFLVCLQYLVSFFQCATKVGHNQVLTRGHELGVWKGGGGAGGEQQLAHYNPIHHTLV